MRENGSNIIFDECSDVLDNTCLTTDDPPANVNHQPLSQHDQHHQNPSITTMNIILVTKVTWDCKDIDNYQCSSLDQLFEVGANFYINMVKRDDKNKDKLYYFDYE